MSRFVDPTQAKLAELDPHFRSRVVPFLTAVRSVGVPLIVISGFRSPMEQARLVALGVGARQSRHLGGRAIDVQWLGFTRDQVPAQWWEWIGLVGEWFGLRWGGRFRAPDVNHFDAG